MAHALRRFLQEWFMPFGLLLFCCGMFVATGRTAYKTMVYLGLLAPAIAMVVLAPKATLTALLGNPLRLAIAVFAFWAASSGSWAAQQGESDSFLKYAVFIVLFALALSRPVGISDERLLGVLRLSIALAGAYAVYSVLSWYVWQSHDWAERFNGLPPLYNPLVTGYFIGFFVALAMSDFVAFRLRRWAFVLYLPAVAALLVVVLLTQSRTPLLAWLVTALLLALVQRKLRGWAVAGLAVIGAVLLFTFNEALWERGLSWRPWIWNHVFERFLDKPWLGHGLGDELLIVIPANGWLFYDPHNMHLSVLYFTGLAGGLLWLAVLGIALRALWQQRHTPQGLLFLGLLAYGMVACSFDGGYLIARPRENWFTLWLPLVLAARLLDPPPQDGAA